MSLEEYKRKRRFKETPEPPPKLEKKSRHRFVVQKHRATRLHYDFRLEMEGVLKSWAVPKGPSLDPADKRLAMMVEDHPVSYFDFEGTIPEGNYGAGTVMVWDTGSWEPLGDAAAMLKKGDLKFRLQGEKLKGEFVLAKMRSSRMGSKGTEWLLIKKKDEFAKPGAGDNLEELDYSVLTNRSLNEIAGDKDSAEWQSNRKAATRKGAEWLNKEAAPKRKAAKKKTNSIPHDSSTKTSAKKSAPTKAISAQLESLAGAHRTPMPAAIYPMLATLVEDPFDDDPWLFEVMWGGYRALNFLQDARAQLV